MDDVDVAMVGGYAARFRAPPAQRHSAARAPGTVVAP
jgi:hypothetical protein